MPDLLQTLAGSLDAGTLSRLSGQIGADPATTGKAVSAAMPLLIGALAKNANRSKDDARQLAHALERDHDGSLLDNLGALLGGGGGGGGGLGSLLGAAGSLLGGGGVSPKAADGAGILGHILGGKRPAVEQGLGQATGLQAPQVQQLLVMLAPLVMGALGKVKRSQNLDEDGVAALLNRERAEVEEETAGADRGGLLGMLDADDDGQVMDDVAKMGAKLAQSGLLKSLFRG